MKNLKELQELAQKDPQMAEVIKREILLALEMLDQMDDELLAMIEKKDLEDWKLFIIFVTESQIII